MYKDIDKACGWVGMCVDECVGCVGRRVYGRVPDLWETMDCYKWILKSCQE